MIDIDWSHIVASIVAFVIVALLKIIGGELKQIVLNLNKILNEWDNFKETIINHENKLGELLELKTTVVKVEERLGKIEKILED